MNRILPPLALGLVLGPLLTVGGCGKQSGTLTGPTAGGEVLPEGMPGFFGRPAADRRHRQEKTIDEGDAHQRRAAKAGRLRMASKPAVA